MKFALILFAVFCAFASVMASAVGSAEAGTVRAPAAIEVSLGGPEACIIMPAEPAATIFKPCGKLLNGLAVLCHADPAVVPTGVALACRSGAPVAVARAIVMQPGTRPMALFRPPRSMAPDSNV